MNDQQKFYADITRSMKHARSLGRNGAGVANAAADFFISWNTEAPGAVRELARYWLETKVADIPENGGPSAESIDWLADVTSLLAGELDKDRGFSAEDWAEIRTTVNCEAEDMPLDLLSAILSIMLERGALDE